MKKSIIRRAMHLLRAAAIAVTLSVVLSAAAPGQTATGAIAGRVLSPEGTPLGHAVVTLTELDRRVEVGDDAAFRFEGLPPGRYLLLAEGPRAGSALAQVTVAAGETVEVDLRLEAASHSESIVVSATADPRRQLEVAQPTTVVSGEELERRRQMTLGQTLAEQPGVTSTYFGPGASRPVIRGLGGDRVRMLNDGLGSGDASNTSPDHAVSIDPLTAERIEILRGPATLLYGSSAVGGVVNTIDSRIPTYVPSEAAHGTLDLTLGSAAEERSAAAVVQGGRGKLAWHADFLARRTDDYEIPGLPEEGHPEDEPFTGVLENSSTDNRGGALGLSWITDRGYAGLAMSGFDSDYGVPGHHHGHEDDHEGDHEDDEGEEGHDDDHEGEEEPVRIDLRQRRVDFRGGLNRELGIFRGMKTRVGYADYEHLELEGEEIGTSLTSESVEARVDLVQKRRGALTGAVGFQGSRTDFVAEGEEAFVPPSVTDSFAAFLFEEIEAGALRYQLGARVESHSISPDGDLPSRSFAALSGSAGLVWALAEDLAFTASLSRTERAPTANELYADGPHAATRSFEIGDIDLTKEVSLGLDVALRAEGERFTGAATLFVNRFDGFIYESFSGEVEDGLDVVRFVQRDAEFYGAELDGSARLAELWGGHLDLTGTADFVRAELRATGDPLPRIPPARYAVGLDFHSESWGASLEARHNTEQDRIAANETPTPSHTLLNASVSRRLYFGESIVDLLLRGTNLTDELALVHTSFLKNEAPLPGRDLSLNVRLSF